MKIIYVTDIHDGLKELKKLLESTTADLYILSGDIIYKAFFNEERIMDFCEQQDEISKLIRKSGEDITPYDFATRVIRFPEKYSEKIQVQSSLYRVLFQQAAKTMKEKYDLVEKLIQKYSNSETFVLPGNYDIDLQYTALYERDLHRKVREFRGLKICGYGGAPISTSGIPEKLAVKFHEYSRGNYTYSEPEDFLLQEEPDIVVIHNPAFGFLDLVPSFGHIGSQGIRRYLDTHSPLLVLSGHVHEDQGIIKKRGTVYLNPSNFGPVESVSNLEPGGFYSEIFIDNRAVKKVKLMLLRSSSSDTLVEVETWGDNVEVVYQNDYMNLKQDGFVRV